MKAPAIREQQSDGASSTVFRQPSEAPFFEDGQVADPFFGISTDSNNLVQRTESEGPITDPEEIAGEVRTRERQEEQHLSYAFFYTGGGYGNSAREFFSTFYPEHIQVSAQSFEGMFDRLYRDVMRRQSQGEQVHIDEIVIVTHANSAGGLQIPLARDDVQRGRNFTPWDLSSLQEEFQDATNEAFQSRQRFRERRHAVVEQAIDGNTSVVVRGCEFGQSREGLEALRSFFGGNIHVWAPDGFQGYEVAGIGSSHLDSAAEAFDMLQNQGLIPQDLDLSDEEKRLYLANELGIEGRVPSQFFIMGDEDRAEMRRLVSGEEGLGEQAEALKEREPTDIPSGGDYWSFSAPGPYGRDPELDDLSLAEIERRARILNSQYRPAYAPMLQRLSAAWERHPDQRERVLNTESDDPLFGLPPSEIFGSPNIVASDAARFEEHLPDDMFETEILPFAPPSEDTTSAAETFETGPGEVDPNAPEQARRASGGGPRRPQHDEQGRQIATPEQLAAARDFRKSRQLAEPEEDDCALSAETRANDLGVGIQRTELVQSILSALPPDGWRTSDYVSLADLTVNIMTAPTFFVSSAGASVTASGVAWTTGAASLAALEVAGLFAPLVFTWVGFMVTYSEAMEDQEHNAEAFGVDLGLRRLLGDPASPGETNAETIERWMEINWARNSGNISHHVAFGYPLSGEQTQEFIRSGMTAVLRASQNTYERTLRVIRAEMRNCGVPDADIERALEAAGGIIQGTVNTAVARTIRQLLEQRMAAIRARD